MALSMLIFRPLTANASDKLSEIQEQIKTKILEVTETEKQEKSMRSKINRIDSTINEKKQKMKSYDKRISQTQSRINAISNEIGLINEKLDSRKQYLKERIIAIYKRQYGGKALVLISAEDYQDLIRKSNYLSLMAYYDSTVIDEYSTRVNDANLKKEEIKKLQEQLIADKKSIRESKEHLQADRRERDMVLARLQARKATYEKNLRKLEMSSKKLQSVINGIKTKTIPQAILGKGFNSLKGSLAWPVDGRVTIPFGKYRDPEFNVISFQKGIKIETTPEHAAKAVAGGRVVYANKMEGYGMVLIIDHGSGYKSLYGNLSETSIKTGELLIKGMEVGSVNRSGSSANPVLHFEIRHMGKPVNPMSWLKKKG
jgi:septal ring factor EnvC (AmiA/AmiB activator)